MGRLFSLTHAVHHILRSLSLPQEGWVVDMTAGRGHDTLFLWEQFSRYPLLALDIQQEAIDATRKRLAGTPRQAPATLITGCHSEVGRVLQELSAPKQPHLTLAMYNLGYLPRGNKGVTTQSHSTLESLESARALLLPGGMLSIMLYPGHEEGAHEAQAVASRMRSWQEGDPSWVVWQLGRWEEGLALGTPPAPLWLGVLHTRPEINVQRSEMS